MRVVVNQMAALGIRTGIGHYTVELTRCLKEQAGANEVDGFPRGLIRRARESCARLRPRLEGTAAPTPEGYRPVRRPWRSRLLGVARHVGREMMARHFRAVVRLHGYDLYHEPNFVPLPCDLPTIVTLHDLSVLLHPEWHPVDRVAYFDKHFVRGLKRCAHFLAISDYCRNEIIRTLGLPPGQVTRTYMGIRPGLSPLSEDVVAPAVEQLGLPPRYLLYLGTIEPRKNLLVLLRAYCSLPARLRERWPLVLVGSWGWNAADVAAFLNTKAKGRGVHHLGYVAESSIPIVYNGARALVYPSLYEGFGMPPIEMMACGGAVIASTAGSLVETVGHRAHLVDPADEDGWRDALFRITTDDDWWESLRAGVTGVANEYTWDRCAADTLRVYHAIHLGRPIVHEPPLLRRAG